MSRFVRMNSLLWFALLLALGAVSRQARGQAAAAPAAEAAQERVVVLRDGGVLSGQVRREGDTYVILRGGSQIRLADARVLVVCESLEDAYRQRRRQLARPTAEAHLALAEWCLNYDLLPQARAELAAARTLDERQPRLVLVERRLALAEGGSRKAAAAESARATKPTPADHAEFPRSVASDVPARVVERFTRKVQPVLVNNCTAGGCHQPGGSEPFQIDRALLHGLANRRSTMSNLAAALAVVDRQRPELSPLLTVPRRAHGGMEDAIFGPRQEQAFRHLADWVALVTQNDVPTSAERAPGTNGVAHAVAEEAAAPESPAEATATAGGADRAATGDLITNGAGLSATNGVVDATSYDDEFMQRAPASPTVRFGARIEKWQPRDPFDPEIFNRRLSARRRATSAAAPAAVETNP